MIFDWVVTHVGNFYVVVAIGGVLLIVTTGDTIKDAMNDMIDHWKSYFHDCHFDD